MFLRTINIQASAVLLGGGKKIVKVDGQYIYVQSDIKGRTDVFDEHGDKVKEIKTENLK